MTKSYGVIEWREDVKKVLMKAGGDGRPTVFLLSDTQVNKMKRNLNKSVDLEIKLTKLSFILLCRYVTLICRTTNMLKRTNN